MAEREFIIKRGVLKKYTGPSEKMVIPDDAAVIDSSAFEKCGITSVKFPKGLTRIYRTRHLFVRRRNFRCETRHTPSR